MEWRNRVVAHPDVLVGTPGRLVDHLERGSLVLEGVRTVVLDEADEMLDLGFRDELEAILGRLPAERTLHLVSATFAGDVLAEGLTLGADVGEGTLLAIGDVGAYGLAMASGYNGRLLPAQAVVESGGVRLSRRRQTLEDVVARDV